MIQWGAFLKLCITAVLIIIIFSGCYTKQDVHFIGEIVSAETDGKLIRKNGERFVIVSVVFSVIDADDAFKKENAEFEIKYQIMRTDPDIESLRIDKTSLLDWTFHKGNIYKVDAEYRNGNYVERVYSVQDLGIVQWSSGLGGKNSVK